MKADIGISYLRLSDDEIGKAESESITNQRRIINDYCDKNGITLIAEFCDDGASGGNFSRVGFQKLLQEIQNGKASVIVTKDLSRLGRSMDEASYYAERYFPEHGIRYIAINDNFDSSQDNVLAPFQFAMNEVYLRDGSKKVKAVLKNKRENGLYCACPPYGYKKDDRDKNHLVPDENTAPVVQRIFERAAEGDSSRKIALDLNNDKVIPPLKYRVLYRDNFSEKGASRVSDSWNYTTVKRILKNRVYLGHTELGKTKKVSVKSSKKVVVDKKDWAITKNTHKPLVSEEVFDRAQKCLGKNTKQNMDYDRVRKSIFSGIVFCSKCGHALCSCGSVYKGEREKYWYLGCTQKRKGALHPCSGVRIKYTDLLEIVKQDLNTFIRMTDEQIQDVVDELIRINNSEQSIRNKKTKIEKAKSRIDVIDKMVSKLYLDNAEGRISDDRLNKIVAELEDEYKELNEFLNDVQEDELEDSIKDKINKFFEIVKRYTEIKEVTREILLTFIDRIEVEEKIFPEGVVRNTHLNQPFTQVVKISYKFINDMLTNSKKEFPIDLEDGDINQVDINIKQVV